jgi:hypothetical protein
MGITPFKAALDNLLEDAEALIFEFGDEFTFKQFLQTATKRNQQAYIDLLVASRHNENPFNVAHLQIGKRLSEIVVRLGYGKMGTRKIADIFGNDFDDPIYRRNN